VKKKLLSLFSGCGGMDLGFEGGFRVFADSVNFHIHSDWGKEDDEGKVLLPETIFENVFANDILESARAAWVPYFNKRKKEPDTFHIESIVNLVKSHKQGEFKFPEGIDIVTGGFPCQDFSVAGMRKGFNSHKSHLGCYHGEDDNPTTENRGLLYTWMKEVIEITKPKMFIAENVKGLVSIGNVKAIIEEDFRSIDKDGYLVIPPRVLNSAEFGVPQNRERIFFIGFNKKLLKKEALKVLSNDPTNRDYNPYPFKTHCRKDAVTLSLFDETRLQPYVILRHIFKGLNEPSEEIHDLSQMQYSKARYYGKKQQGNVEIRLDDIGPTIRSEHHGNIEFRRLSIQNGGVIFDEINKGLPERRLTVRECARIQTFPDDYEFIRNGNKRDPFNISASAAYKLIGNAVPPFFAYNIAKRLEEIWDRLFFD